jgi:hypothetical protein
MTFHDCLEFPLIKEKLPYLKLLTEDLCVSENPEEYKNELLNKNSSSYIKLELPANSVRFSTKKTGIKQLFNVSLFICFQRQKYSL